MRESYVTKKINDLLAMYKPKVWWYRPVPGIYGSRSVDYIGIAYSIGFGIEAKRPDWEPTDAQYLELERIHAAGGASFHIHDDDSLSFFAGWLHGMGDTYVVNPHMPMIPLRRIKVI